jgi:hypothetical protein
MPFAMIIACPEPHHAHRGRGYIGSGSHALAIARGAKAISAFVIFRVSDPFRRLPTSIATCTAINLF